ncbi:MAG: hypothetical protein KC493_00490 [Bacteriovoracaceae bacterium]|nr:hypothetical protein [Bacteriovoracaceae bacterium]
MKTILTIMILAFTLGVKAEEYKAPSVKFNDKSPKAKVDVKKGEWESGLSYKVEEDPAADRNIASDEDESGRDPSSTEEMDIPKVEKWDFEDIENSPVE